MTTQYVLQKLNYDRNRRFIAEILAEQGGTTPRLNHAKKWDSAADAEQFRLLNDLINFSVVLSDGTDDHQTEIKNYWEQKGKTK
jgi:hypothetical protein